MATLAVQQIVEAGLKPTYVAADSLGDTFANDGSGRQFIHVINGLIAVTVTVTPEVASTTKPGFGALTRGPMVVAILADEDQMIGPFPLTAFGINPAITYDDETNVTVAAIRT